MMFLAAATLPPLFILLAVMLMGVVLMSLLLLRLQQSLLAGYFLCGVVIANSGVLNALGGAATQAGISQMSEFGVMLLMFTLGLELSLGELKYVRRLALRGGGWQMALCMAVAAGGAWMAGITGAGVLLLAVALAMSSTAVSLKTFQDLGQEGSPGARMSLAVALFQDLFIIVFFLILPLLLPEPGAADAEQGMLARVGSLAWRGCCLWCWQGPARVGSFRRCFMR